MPRWLRCSGGGAVVALLAQGDARYQAGHSGSSLEQAGALQAFPTLSDCPIHKTTLSNIVTVDACRVAIDS